MQLTLGIDAESASGFVAGDVACDAVAHQPFSAELEMQLDLVVHVVGPCPPPKRETKCALDAGPDQSIPSAGHVAAAGVVRIVVTSCA